MGNFILFLCITITILLHVVSCASYFDTASADNFGPYILQHRSLELCRGPKSINSTKFEAKLEDKSNMTWIYLNFTFLADVKIEEVKIMVYTIKGNDTNLVWVYNMPHPCRHFFIADVLMMHLKANACSVKKGFYSITQLLTGLSENFLGPTFFYGSFLFKVRMLSKKANLACFSVMSVIMKKT